MSVKQHDFVEKYCPIFLKHSNYKDRSLKSLYQEAKEMVDFVKKNNPDRLEQEDWLPGGKYFEEARKKRKLMIPISRKLRTPVSKTSPPLLEPNLAIPL